MRSLLVRLLGVPLTAEHKARVFQSVVGKREGAEAIDLIFQVIAHNTGKSGALLGAQGMFVVVATYASDHNWSSALVFPAMVLLFIGALFAISILHSTGAFYEGSKNDPARNMFDLLLLPMLRFNLALYMTFLAVILLLAAALVRAW